MVAVQPVAPTRPPSAIEDFLWNMHSVLVHTPGPLEIDLLGEAYSKRMGHKFAIERFLVVGEGGLAATLKRIPHIVTPYVENGVTCIKASQDRSLTKQGLIEADQAYRRELSKKSAQAKAKSANGNAPKSRAAPKADEKPPSAVVGAAPSKTAATVAPASPAVGEKRPAEGAASGGGDAAKKTKVADSETLAKMLVQGVARVLQNRAKAGKGPLPLNELETEFTQLWQVPFDLAQAGETDTAAFLQKWPNKVELIGEGSRRMVQLSTKTAAKKAAGTVPAATGKKTQDGPQTLQEARQEAANMLESIKDMLRRQQTLVAALDRLAA